MANNFDADPFSEEARRFSGENVPHDNPSVSVWIRQLIAGDKDLPTEKLWERYFTSLVGLARTKLGHLSNRIADEEDVALSAFDSFCRGAMNGRFPDLNDRASLWRLLVTITARKAYQLNLGARRQKRGGAVVFDEAVLARGVDSARGFGLEQFISYEPTPEFAAQAAEEYQLLLARLPDEQLREITQWKMEGFTNDEIAAKLDCASRTVERKLHVIRSFWSAANKP